VSGEVLTLSQAGTTIQIYTLLVGYMTAYINKTARWISHIMNPYPITLALLLAISYTSSGTIKIFAVWAAILLLCFIAVPFGYISIKNRVSGHTKMRLQEPTTFFRGHRNEIWILGIVSLAIFIPSLIFLGASSDLYAAFAALIVTSLAIALVNRYYKASFHLAIITSVVTIVVLIWGQQVLPLIAIIPLVGWARYALQQHTPYQLAAGFGLAVIISFPILYYLINPAYLFV
jgi:membrane-associated phospholipid phosphatase